MSDGRPRYHVLPPANWLNDPNGVIQGTATVNRATGGDGGDGPQVAG